MKTWMIALVLSIGSAGMLGTSISGCMSSEKAQEVSDGLKKGADTVNNLPVPSPWKDIAAGGLNLLSILFAAYAAETAKKAASTAGAAHSRLDDQLVPAAGVVKNGIK